SSDLRYVYRLWRLGQRPNRGAESSDASCERASSNPVCEDSRGGSNRTCRDAATSIRKRNSAEDCTGSYRAWRLRPPTDTTRVCRVGYRPRNSCSGFILMPLGLEKPTLVTT